MAQFKETENIDDLQADFLERLADSGNVSDSARLANIPRRTLYNWRNENESFRIAWDEAVELGVDSLEDEATRRAKDGVDEPVFYKGQECGSVRRYSDTLMIFLLKGRRPDKFKDRTSAEISGPNGAPLVTEVVIVHHKPTAEIDNTVGGDGETVERQESNPS